MVNCTAGRARRESAEWRCVDFELALGGSAETRAIDFEDYSGFSDKLPGNRIAEFFHSQSGAEDSTG